MRLNTCIKITGEEFQILDSIAENPGFISRTYLITAWIHPLICKKAAYGEPPLTPSPNGNAKPSARSAKSIPSYLRPAHTPSQIRSIRTPRKSYSIIADSSFNGLKRRSLAMRSLADL